MNPHRKRQLRGTREAIAFASPRLLPRVLRPTLPRTVLQEYSDRRLYHPNRVLQAPFSFVRSDARIVDRRPVYKPTMLSFAVPRRVAICIRRKDRREVLHARGVAGGRVRRPRHNKWSGIKC